MKGILEFDLPEEREEFETAQRGVLYKIAIEDFYNKSLRARRKYQDLTGKDPYELLEEIIEEFANTMPRED